MGADMLLLTLWTENAEIDVEKAITVLREHLAQETDPEVLTDAAQFVGAIAPAGYGDLAEAIRAVDAEADKAWRAQILDGYRTALTTFVAGLSSRRDITTIEMGPLTGWATGGMSHGDGPTQSWDDWYALFIKDYEPGFGENPYTTELYEALFIASDRRWVRPGTTRQVAQVSVETVTGPPRSAQQPQG